MSEVKAITYRGHRVSLKDQEEMFQLHLKNWSNVRIADKFLVTESTVRRIKADNDWIGRQQREIDARNKRISEIADILYGEVAGDLKNKLFKNRKLKDWAYDQFSEFENKLVTERGKDMPDPNLIKEYEKNSKKYLDMAKSFERAASEALSDLNSLTGGSAILTTRKQANEKWRSENIPRFADIQINNAQQTNVAGMPPDVYNQQRSYFNDLDEKDKDDLARFFIKAKDVRTKRILEEEGNE